MSQIEKISKFIQLPPEHIHQYVERYGFEDFLNIFGRSMEIVDFFVCHLTKHEIIYWTQTCLGQDLTAQKDIDTKIEAAETFFNSLPKQKFASFLSQLKFGDENNILKIREYISNELSTDDNLFNLIKILTLICRLIQLEGIPASMELLDCLRLKGLQQGIKALDVGTPPFQLGKELDATLVDIHPENRFIMKLGFQLMTHCASAENYYKILYTMYRELGLGINYLDYTNFFKGEE